MDTGFLGAVAVALPSPSVHLEMNRYFSNYTCSELRSRKEVCFQLQSYCTIILLTQYMVSATHVLLMSLVDGALHCMNFMYKY
jgi:hypothetical protein